MSGLSSLYLDLILIFVGSVLSQSSYCSGG